MEGRINWAAVSLSVSEINIWTKKLSSLGFLHLMLMAMFTPATKLQSLQNFASCGITAVQAFKGTFTKEGMNLAWSSD